MWSASTSGSPVFNRQTGNLSEIGSIACDNSCVVGEGDGGYSQVLAAGLRELPLQVGKNGNGGGASVIVSATETNQTEKCETEK